MPELHFKYGGSKIELIELCPGSRKAIDDLGPISAGPAAERGTRIHTRVEQLWKDPQSKSALVTDEETIAKEVVIKLREVFAEHGFEPSEVEIEKRVTLHLIHNEAGGTADQVAFRVFGDLIVGDLKCGFNQVKPDGNLQLAYYAVGVLQNLDAFTRFSLSQGKVHLIIFQPEQQPPYEVTVRKWTTTIAELDAYAVRFKAIIDRAEAEPDNRIAGSHCKEKYCNARAVCTAYANWINDESLGALGEALTGIKPEPGRGGKLTAQLKALPLLKDFASATEELATQLLMVDPEAVPEYGLVDSFGNRSVKDEKALIAELKKAGLKADDYSPRKIMTAAQLEKVCKAKKIEIDLSPFVDRPFIGRKLKQVESADAKLAELFAPQEASPAAAVSQ